MRIIACMTESAAIRAIVGDLDEPAVSPRVMPAQGPTRWRMPGDEPGEFDPQSTAIERPRVRSDNGAEMPVLSF